MSVADFLYYTVLKKGGIIIIALGVFLFVLIFIYIGRFGTGVSEVTSASLRECVNDVDCFFHCGDCYSIKPTQYCANENNEIAECICKDNRCQIA